MDKTVYLAGIKRLVHAFKDKDIDHAFMWEYLQDLKDTDFIQAIDQLIMNSDQVNRATNLIAVIRKLADGNGRNSAEIAWTEVLYKAAHWDQNIKLDDVAETAARCVGWDRLRFGEDLSHDRAFFIRAYNNYIELTAKESSKAITDKRIQKLCGDVAGRIGKGDKC